MKVASTQVALYSPDYYCPRSSREEGNSYSAFKQNIKKFVCGSLDNVNNLVVLAGALSAGLYGYYCGELLDESAAETLEKFSRATLYGVMGGALTKVPCDLVNGVVKAVASFFIDQA